MDAIAAPSPRVRWGRMSSRYNPPSVSDTDYDATSWDGVASIAPSKRAVRDKLVALEAAASHNVELYLPGRTVGAAFQAAIDAAQADGRGGVYVPNGLWDLAGTTVVLKSHIRIYGDGPGTIITSTVDMGRMFGHGGVAIENVSFENLTFLGNAVDEGVYPRRARTRNPGPQTAFQFDGSRVTSESNPVVRDILVRNCRFINLCGSSTGNPALPILLRGVSGVASVTNSFFRNCMDPGFTFCESVIFNDNHIEKGADNGVSISRGCEKVVCSGNEVDECAYFGIWVSGFATTTGPKYFSVVANTVRRSGRGAIRADDAPKYGLISSNTIHTVFRGPTDEPSDNHGIGIFVGGYPTGTPETPSDFAEALGLYANSIVGAQRGGVLVRGARHIDIKSNLIVDAGTQYLADGVTAIVSTDPLQNFGVAVDQTNPTIAATVTNLTVHENTIIDTRAVAFTNFPTLISNAAATESVGNRAINTRQAVTDSPQTFTGTKTFAVQVQAAAGIRAGANSGVSGFFARISGPAEQARDLEFSTSDSRRWVLRADTTAESGSNAGSNLTLLARDDAGNLLHTVWTIDRVTGRTTWGEGMNFASGTVTGTKIGTSNTQKLAFFGQAPIVQPTGTPVASTDLASAIALVNSLRTSLIALGLVV